MWDIETNSIEEDNKSYFDKLPSRIKHYILDWKDSNIDKYISKYGEKKLKDMDMLELYNMFKWMGREDLKDHDLWYSAFKWYNMKDKTPDVNREITIIDGETNEVFDTIPFVTDGRMYITVINNNGHVTNRRPKHFHYKTKWCYKD